MIVWPAEDDLAVELQVAHVAPLVAVDVVEVGGVGEPGVEGEVAGNLLRPPPSPPTPGRTRCGRGRRSSARQAFFPLDEPAEFQRIVLAAGADVVDDQIVVGDLVPFLGVVPEVAGVLDELAGVVDQDVVQRNHALFAVAGGRVLLEPVQPELG